MTHQSSTSLQHKINERRALRGLCAQAVAQQIEAGNAEASHLRNRKRYLAKQVLKKIPSASRRSPRKLLHAATMVLAMWGFAGLSIPTTAEAAPVFKHQMLDGFAPGSAHASPSLVDIDGDGDMDVFVGAYNGIVKFYENTGSNSVPLFTPSGTTDANGIIASANPLAAVALGNSSKSSPTFADIDGDGDLDVFIGNTNGGGTVRFYENTGSNSVPLFTPAGAIDINGVTAKSNPLVAASGGAVPKPTFADIDGDGDLDAFVGQFDGTVRFFQNNGSYLAPAFVAVIGAGNPLNGFDVGRSSAPDFVDIDGDGDLDVFIGDNYSSTVKFYRNNDVSGTGTVPAFVADVVTGDVLGLIGYGPVNPAFADVDGDGDFDAFIGDSSGTVRFFRNTGNSTVANFTSFPANPLRDVYAGSNTAATPSFVDIDGDGDLDSFVGGGNNKLNFYQNNGNSTAPIFVATTSPIPSVKVGGGYAAPAFGDIDNDGDLDAFVGDYYGHVYIYTNSGSAISPAFTTGVDISTLMPALGFLNDTNNGVGYYAKPALADIDGDGDLDLFLGGGNVNGFAFFRNDGTNVSPSFTAATNPITVTGGLRNLAPSFADIDRDGDLDAFIGASDGTVKFYRNNGTSSVPSFTADVAGNPLAGFDVWSDSAPTFADIDGDGDLDAFVGNNRGKVSFFENFDNGTVGPVAIGGGGCVIQSSSKFASIFPMILVLLAGIGLIRRRQK